MVNKKTNFGVPGPVAWARNRVGGDWAAALLLYRLMWRWKTIKNKLKRLGKEWVAMSRSSWALESGLSNAEMKNRALPNLRKQSFVTIRAMKLGDKKLLWMSLDEEALFESAIPWDMYDAQLNWKGVGTKKPGYPYQEKYLSNGPKKDAKPDDK